MFNRPFWFPSVFWIYDPVGRNGKTLFGDYAASAENALIMPMNTSISAWKKALDTKQDDEEFFNLRLVIVNLIRDDKRLIDPLKRVELKNALEWLADQVVEWTDVDGETHKEKLKVLVLSNEDPVRYTLKLSQNRLRLFLIGEKLDLVYSKGFAADDATLGKQRVLMRRIEQKFCEEATPKNVSLFQFVIIDDLKEKDPTYKMSYKSMLAKLCEIGDDAEIGIPFFSNTFRVNTKRSKGVKQWKETIFKKFVEDNFPALYLTMQKDEHDGHRYSGLKQPAPTASVCKAPALAPAASGPPKRMASSTPKVASKPVASRKPPPKDSTPATINNKRDRDGDNSDDDE